MPASIDLDDDKVSIELREQTRITLNNVCQAIKRITQQQLADTLGTSQSTVNRVINNDLQDSIALMLAAGFQIVPADLKYFDPAEVESLLYFTKQYLAGIQSVWQLTRK